MNTFRDGGDKLTLVIPVYNEGQNFDRLWSTVVSKIRCDLEALVVYDFDEDDTVPAVRAVIEQGETRIRLVKNASRGVVEAIVTGFENAVAGPVLVVMADLSDDLGQVDEMLALYNQGFDLIAGSRYAEGGSIVGGPLVKKTLSRMAGISLHFLRGIPTTDATNAFKMYDSDMLRKIKIESRGGFEVSLEITVKAFLSGYKITEIPTTWNDRTEGSSKFKLWQWLPGYLRWYLYAFRPIHGT